MCFVVSLIENPLPNILIQKRPGDLFQQIILSIVLFDLCILRLDDIKMGK